MHAFDRQTDRQTDGQTDGRTDRNLIVRPRCIPCSAVKIKSFVVTEVLCGVSSTVLDKYLSGNQVISGK